MQAIASCGCRRRSMQALAELVNGHERNSDLHRMLALDYYAGAPGGSPEWSSER